MASLRPLRDVRWSVLLFTLLSLNAQAQGTVSEEIFNLNTMRADEVAGVEFYSGSGTMPRELSAPRGTCGALVIWTKR